MHRTLITETSHAIGQVVTLCGWISIRRDHGKLVFLDIRDHTGEIQTVVLPSAAEAHAIAQEVRPEWVVRVVGQINARPAKLVNPHQLNGSIELLVSEITVLSRSVTPPFDLLSHGREIGEEHRLKYRYLDLRRSRMQRNLRMRHAVNQFVRNFLSKEGFIEVETPYLTKSTPEGSRDYIVPSRLEPGKFYALPQSPQQYKQLLMVGGIDRYFQIARCMRDEDSRGDRQPEFTQLDMEMSFVEREDVMALNERLLIQLVQTLFPEKRIQEIPFPRLSYAEVMEKYQSDKPDIRKDRSDPNLLAFLWVVDFPQFEKTDDGKWTFTHNPFSAPKEKHIEWLMKEERIGEIEATQYDIVLNGFEIGGGGIRSHQPEILERVFEVMGYSKDAIRKNFGHMLEAFSYGAPPHGGIAWGLDRLLAILLDEPNIRETIAFPKTGEGKDLMMQAPSEVSVTQLDELGLRLK